MPARALSDAAAFPEVLGFGRVRSSLKRSVAAIAPGAVNGQARASRGVRVPVSMSDLSAFVGRRTSWSFEAVLYAPAHRLRRKCAAILGRRSRVNAPLKFIPPARLVPWPVLKSAKFHICIPATNGRSAAMSR